MNIENDLNIPPDAEPVSKKISRIATQFLIPVLLPASSAFIASIAQRRVSSRLDQVNKENENVKHLQDEVTNLRDEVKFLESRRSALTSGHLKEIQQKVLKDEHAAFLKIAADLDNMKTLLQKRQQIKCSLFTSRHHRLELEDQQLKPFSYSRSYDKELGLYPGVLDILENDNYCDPHGSKHGHLMWVYMDLWKARAQLRMFKRVVKRIQDA
ncbi:coiled-coil domain-containing protein 127-like [Amphiura filiformis]|uniref:coiled-coil domain-containing protein 127-like n=1 Tax=Amphiura filiformis TaxID=82378 RepID=UPI003B21ACF3